MFYSLPVVTYYRVYIDPGGVYLPHGKERETVFPCVYQQFALFDTSLGGRYRLSTPRESHRTFSCFSPCFQSIDLCRIYRTKLYYLLHVCVI